MPAYLYPSSNALSMHPLQDSAQGGFGTKCARTSYRISCGRQPALFTLVASIADQAVFFGFVVYVLYFETEFNYHICSDSPLGGLQIDLHSSYPLSGDHGRYLPALS